MKYFWFILLLSFSSFELSAQGNIDFDKTLVFEKQNYSFQEIISFIEQISDVRFSYSSAVVNPSSNLSLKTKVYTLREIIDEICETLEVSYLELNSKILFLEIKQEWEDYWIYGFLRDASTGEALIGASIYNFNEKIGTESNEFGYFSIKITNRNLNLKISFIGYESVVINKSNSKGGKNDINLKPIFTIPEIVVTPIDTIDSKLILDDIFDKTTKNVNPSLLGQKDILQSLKFLPGIQSGSEVQGNILVRGGGADQNLILMDGVPLYEVNHLLGLSSIFDEDSVNDTDVLTDGFDSKYGGRLSSVINIQIKDGNKYKHKGNVSFGLLGAKVHAEGPIVKEKTSYNISLRASYINRLIKPIAARFLDIEETQFGFSDINLKLHHKLTKSSSFSISTYQGSDVLGFSSTTRNEQYPDIISLKAINTIKWSNNVINVRFNKAVNKKLFFNISASTVNYKLNSRSSNFYKTVINPDSILNDALDVFANSSIKDDNLRTEWEYAIENNHSVTFGGGITRHLYNPSVISTKTVSNNLNPVETLGLSAIEQFIYLEDVHEFTEWLNFSAGFHLSQFKLADENFTSFQPRIRVSFHINPRSEFKLSYSKMTQFVHLLVNPGTGLPSDLWLPSTSRIPPENLSQISAKYSVIWSKNFLSFIGAYYKQFSNLIEYRSAFPLYNPVINRTAIFPLFNNIQDWEDRVEIGNGEAYGIDIFHSLNFRKLRSSISYSFGYSNRVFDLINKGKPFPYKYDRRHDIAVTSTYFFHKRLSIGANFVYGSGHATTFAVTEFLDISGERILDFSQRNNVRLPAYHRLDVNINYKKKLNHIFDLEFTFGFYNLYNRLNPYYVYLYQDSETREFSPRQVGIFPVLPFFNLKLNY